MKRILLAALRFYQRYVSPVLPPACRYYPTCSTYMINAVERFGVLRGGLMGIARLLRCNPLCRPGYDPVPDHFSLRRNRDAHLDLSDLDQYMMQLPKNEESEDYSGTQGKKH